jgi:long-chain acyl-CoA synthetase
MPPILESRPKPALVWNDVAVSYDDLLRRAWACSRLLKGADERIAVFSENRCEWVYAAYGIWAARKVLVPVDHMSSAEEVAYVLDDCTPSAVFCSEKTRPALDRALALCRHRPRVLGLEDLAAADLPSGPTDEQAPPPLVVDEDCLAAIVYTSGTTGDPKGVMLSFGNLLANVVPVADEGYFTLEARVLLLLPLHHVLPLAGALMAPLLAGSTIVFATSLAGPELLATLQRNAVTTIVGVPRFYDLLARALRERIRASGAARALFSLARRLGSRRFSRSVFAAVHRKMGGRLEHLISGGAALDPETARVFDTLGFLVCEGYGMTECSPMISFPRLRDARIKLGSCGQVLRGCEVKIEDGEVLARGPNVMRGYYGRPEETAAVLRDGWIRTGDLGRLDDEGYLYVTGRAKEILVLPSGKNVNPLPIEAELAAASAAVKEVAVFLDGETLHALIVVDRELVPAAERGTTQEWLRRELIAPYNARVAPYKRIARATVLGDELPRTRIGKLRRHQLAAIAKTMTREVPAPPAEDEDPAVARLAAFLERQCQRPVRADSRLDDDLGLDSLARVELAVFLERAFGVTVPETRLAELATVADLARFVAGKRTAGDEGAELSWGEILAPRSPVALPHSSLLHRALLYASRVAVRLYFRTRAQGLERLPKGPFILAPNHQSFFDGLFVIAHMRPRAALRTLFYAKAKHVERLWLSAVARRSNVVVMRAGENLLQSLQALAAGLRRGDNVMIFPEGTRSANGILGPFKESYAILARELAVPVVPVVIDGAHRVLPTGRWLPRLLGKISVTYLDPVWPRVGESVAALNQRVRDVVAAQLAGGRAHELLDRVPPRSA